MRRRRVRLVTGAVVAVVVAVLVAVTVVVGGQRSGTAVFDDGAPVASVAVVELGGRPVIVSGGGSLTGQGPGTVHIRDLATGVAIREPLPVGERLILTSLAPVSVGGRPAVVAGDDNGSYTALDLETGAAVGRRDTNRAYGNSVKAVAAAPLGGRTAVVAARRGSVSGLDAMGIWDLGTGASIGDPLRGHAGVVQALVATQVLERPVVVSGAFDRTVRVWDLATGAPVGGPFTGHTGGVAALATAQLDGRAVVVSGSADRTVRVWDLATGTPVGAPFTGHTAPVTALAVTELDGRAVVVSGSFDRTVRVWDLATGAPVGDPFTGHSGTVRSLAAAQLDGRPVIVSGADDRTVRVWDL